ITIKKSEYDALFALVKSLEDKIRLLQNGKNSRTSHTSPSQDLQRSNSKSLRTKGANPSGGQPDHEGRTLKMSTTPHRIIDYNEINYTDCKILKSLDCFKITNRIRRLLDFWLSKGWVVTRFHIRYKILNLRSFFP